MNGYEDILYMTRHVSVTRPHMSMQSRAAQFSPFAALSGHGDAINETARLTDGKAELSEDKSCELNEKLIFLNEHAHERPFITVEYFLHDSKKPGGAYITLSGNFRRIDEYNRNLIFAGGEEIPLNDIFSIEC